MYYIVILAENKQDIPALIFLGNSRGATASYLLLLILNFKEFHKNLSWLHLDRPLARQSGQN